MEVADRFGIAENRAQNFHNDKAGIALNYSVLGGVVSSFRSARKCAKIADDWNTEIEADYKRRSRK